MAEPKSSKTYRADNTRIANDSSGMGKDIWSRLQIITNMLAVLAVPVVIAVVGHFVTSSLTNRELDVRIMGLAVDVLKTDPEILDQPNVRRWAITVLERYSDVQFTEEGRLEIQTSPFVTTLSSATGWSSTDLQFLHPTLRRNLQTLLQALQEEGLTFRVIRGFVSPVRQASLWMQGRSPEAIAAAGRDCPLVEPGNGPRVTNAYAWQSLYNYGLAVAVVWIVDGSPEFSASREVDGKNGYRVLAERASEHGLESGGSAEGVQDWPRLQLPNISIDAIRIGQYPDGGDQMWTRNLENEIASWTCDDTAPPSPIASAR